LLDFVNEAERHLPGLFKPYFDATSLQESSDPALLEQLKHALDGFQVYHWSEVEAFAPHLLPEHQTSRIRPTMLTCNDICNRRWIASRRWRTRSNAANSATS
jgi:hypothetical protein